MSTILPPRGWLQRSLSLAREQPNTLLPPINVDSGIEAEPPLNVCLTTALTHCAHNEERTWVCRLPNELHLAVFAHLSAEDLASAALVSRRFYEIANDETLWRHIFKRLQHQWKVACNAAASLDVGPGSWFEGTLLTVSNLVERRLSPAELNAIESRLSYWKRMYLIHQLEDARQRKGRQTKSEDVLRKFGYSPWSFSSLPLFSFLPKSIRDSLGRNQVYKVPMFGRGLDLSAKKLLSNMLWSLDAPFPNCGLHPGSGGIGSGVVFNVDGKKLSLTVIYEEVDVLLYLDKAQPQWRNFIQTESSGLILVMDNRGDRVSIEKVNRELNLFVRFDEHCVKLQPSQPLEPDVGRPLAITAIPLLIFLCNLDKAEETPSSTLTPAQVAEEFKLVDRMKHRKWCIREADPNSFQGIAEGLEWLASNF